MQNLIIECNEFEKLGQWVDKETGVFIDFDNTLVENCTALGHSDWYYALAQRSANEGVPFHEFVKNFYMEWIYVQDHCKIKPVEKTTVSAVKTLQKTAACVMVLTHRQYTTVSMTLRQLAPIDISFKVSTPFDSTFTLRSPFAFPVSHSEGIIFVGDYNLKSQVMGYFAKKLGYRKILFVDDRLGHVKDVHGWCQKEKVNSICVHYRAVEIEKPRIYTPEIAEIQQQEFDKTGKIIGNAEALKLLHSRLNNISAQSRL